MNLTDLQREAHAIAKGKGWWDEPRTFGDCIALVHSDLSAVLEAHRAFHGRIPPNHSWAILGERLADVVIRVADMAEHYGVRLETIDIDDPMPPPLETFGDWITYAHHWVDCVAENHRAGYLTWKDSMSNVVCVVQRIAAHYGIDLDTAIEAKMEYNKTRLYRQGGKAL